MRRSFGRPRKGKILMKQESENEKQIVAYLLGEMTGGERDEFEERLFLDEGLSLLVDDAENDLIDAYLLGELGAGERARFEGFYLTDESRREKVRSAGVLQTELFNRKEEAPTVIASTAGQSVSFWESVRAFFRPPNLVWAGGLAAVILMLLLGGLWFASAPDEPKRAGGDENQIQPNPSPPVSPLPPLPEETRENPLPEKTPVPDSKPENRKPPVSDRQQPVKRPAPTPSKPAPKPVERPRGIFAFTLFPPLRSSERPVMKIPSSTRTVRLQLLDNFGQKYVKYLLELNDSGGGQVWSREVVATAKRPQKSITVGIPAERLKADSYELAVSGISEDGSVEDIGFYNFIVERK